jgi:hypothetical protein
MFKDFLTNNDKELLKDFMNSPEFKTGIIKEFLFGEKGAEVKLRVFFGEESVFDLFKEKGFLVPVRELKDVFLVVR